jgi:hypothetical protein
MRLLILKSILVFSCVIVLAREFPGSNAHIKPASQGVVVMELFTSQGCSSCPPADEILGKYAIIENPNIIPLAFHVDYWNYIGWRDPFSKKEFTQRQNNYSKKLGLNTVYTPQMIINGQYQMTGNKAADIENRVQQELKISAFGTIKIGEVKQIGSGKLNISYACSNFATGNVVNVALVKKKMITNIKRGENEGRKLANYNIVIDYNQFNTASGEVNITTDAAFVPSNYMLVVYQQLSAEGKVICAAKQEIH